MRMRHEAMGLRLRGVQREESIMTPQMKLAMSVVRYILTLSFIWLLIYPETGVWTSLAINLIAAEQEYQHGRRTGWFR